MPFITSGGGEIQAKASRTAQGQRPALRHRELRADADIQHQQSQQRQHGQPGCDGLFPVPFERLQEFFAGRYFLPQATAYSARVDAPAVTTGRQHSSHSTLNTTRSPSRAIARKSGLLFSSSLMIDSAKKLCPQPAGARAHDITGLTD